MPESPRRGRMNLGRRLWSLRNKSNNRLPGRGSDHVFLARLFKALSLPNLFTCGHALRRSATKKAHNSYKSLGNDKALKRRAKVNRRWRGGSGSGNFCKADHLKLNSSKDITRAVCSLAIGLTVSGLSNGSCMNGFGDR
jgi:hypothetical protein